MTDSNSQIDYSTLIDPQTRAFIDKSNQQQPTDTSIEATRKAYSAMCRSLNATSPKSVNTVDDTISAQTHTIPVRRYTRNSALTNAQIIYLHGGGYVLGNLDTHDDICAELCDETGFDVTAVEYRLAPEHLHPAAFNDVCKAVHHEYTNQQKPLLLCGDSAGANLAACAAHYFRDDPTSTIVIKGQVLIYPGLGGDTTTGSYITHAHAPMLTTREMKNYTATRVGNSVVENPVTLAPLKDTNFSNLPNTIAFGAEYDPVCDDAEHYCEAIKAAGGSAMFVKENGLVHGYLRARHSADKARDSFRRIVQALQGMGA